MFVRALLAFLVLPGLVAVLVPPLVALVDPWRSQVWMPGIAVLVAGAAVLLWCVRDFYAAGQGTLAPWDPPKRLVVAGLYRYTRNPMYVGVLLLVSGWAALLAAPLVAAYACVLAVVFHVRVIAGEEPWLESQFGTEWSKYRAAVPRWFPRARAWKDGS